MSDSTQEDIRTSVVNCDTVQEFFSNLVLLAQLYNDTHRGIVISRKDERGLQELFINPDGSVYLKIGNKLLNPELAKLLLNQRFNRSEAAEFFEIISLTFNQLKGNQIDRPFEILIYE